MEIVENKAVKLRLRNPERVTSSIPKSKNMGEVEPGIHEVLVHFGLEESQILKNLKFKGVRSPIAFQYDWPGIHRPFDHQKVTAEFLTLHRRCYLLSEQGCVDAETEYLSPTGWVKISNYAGGKVAQYHPDTGRVEFVDPIEYVKLPCEEMVRIKTKYGIDQLLSPEHRVLLHDGKKRGASLKTEVLSASELLARHDAHHAGFKHKIGGTRYGTQSIAFSAATIPTTFYADGGAGLDISDAALRVQVAVIADGHFGGKNSTCVVRVKKPRKIERLRALLQAAQVSFRERTVVGGSADGFVIFTFTAPLRCKEFDARFWECTVAQRSIIADEALHWDGTIRAGNKGPSFSSTSKASADFIQYAWSAQGRTARIVEDTRPEHYTSGACYTVQIRGEGRGGAHGSLFVKGSGSTVSTSRSTDGYKYCFQVPSTFLVFRRNGCVFCSGNTGKTNAVLWAADYLLKTNRIKRVLIVSPVSIMRSAWVSDAFKCIMHRSIDVAHGSREQRKAVIDGDAEIVVINYDGVDIVRESLKGKFDLIVLDEANYIKTATTKRWKAISRVVGPDTWLWLMTGTPASQSPLDAYGLAKLCTPSRVPNYFGAWRDKTMTKINMYKYVPAPRATELVNEALQPAIRFTKEECLDLPEMLYQTIEVEMGKQQQRYYTELRRKMTISAAGEQITAVHAASALNKLLQLSLGSVYADTGEVVEFDASSRLDAMIDVIQGSSHKTVVFAPFKHTIKLITATLDKAGISVDTINGDVPLNKRTEIFRRFQETDDPQVLVIQPQSAAHGVTLTAASTIIWYGPTMSVETYLQGNARIHRAGQTNKTFVVRLCGSEVERKIYAALDTKELAQEKLLEMYESVVKGE